MSVSSEAPDSRPLGTLLAHAAQLLGARRPTDAIGPLREVALGVFLEGENILERHYGSFGLYGDPPGNGTFPNFTDPRFYTPGEPSGFWLGAQLKF